MTETTTDTTTTDTGGETTTETTTTETTTENPTVASLMAELASVKSALTSLESGKAESDAAAEAARVAALSESEKAAEAQASLLADITAERETLATERASLVSGRRSDALQRMGFDARLHSLAPAADPSTVEGAAQLEQWAKTNADLATKAAAADAGAWQPKPKSMLARVLGGEIRNPLVNADSVSKMFGGSK